MRAISCIDTRYNSLGVSVTQDRYYFLYSGRKTSQISFPLGGIGTGCIGLAGNGRLVDWEIFNKPNKGSLNGFSHFAVKAESHGRVIDARVLHSDLTPPYSGVGKTMGGFGFGPARQNLTGVPHFAEAEFEGEFPVARIAFRGTDAFPGAVAITAFNPFIPLDDRDSGIPAAFFEIEVTNTSGESVDYTLAGVLCNSTLGRKVNSIESDDGITMLHLASEGLDPGDSRTGDLTLATDAQDVSWQQYWFQGEWFDSLEVYWRDFTSLGRLKNRETNTKPDESREGMIAAHLKLRPGETGSARFVISWSFPVCTNYWTESPCDCKCACEPSPNWRNYYATLWPDSRASAKYSIANWDSLHDRTLLFREALFSSDIPDCALDAVSANLSVLKSPTVLRLEDGTFYGWEGCCTEAGCCEGSCTHVWNYAQALPFLFPKLERSMREADYRHNLRPDGGMPFRLQLPIGAQRWISRPCADGQFGGVMKTYRDWKICGDTEWLRSLWPAVKKSIEFAWSPENEDRWDPDKTGVLQGRQHHTLDVELFGPNSWLTGFYLGALKAGAEMAEALGEAATADGYRAVFERGKAWVDQNLFNGEYYHQQIDVRDKSILEPYPDALAAYWNEELGEIKYQIAEGSGIDQVLAQWHANLYGLGEIFDPLQTKAALASLFGYNFRPTMRDYFNACLVYSLNDEGGLVVAHWPGHVYRPMVPITYAGEAMSGFEYAAAVLMIQEGLVEEGMTCVKAVRDRYDGEKRNPWNEFECGSNYARSMASYSLLNAFSGFEFDMTRQMIGFDPIRDRDGEFKCFWSLDPAWGTVTFTKASASIEVLQGALSLRTLRLPGAAARRVAVDENDVAFGAKEGEISFAQPVVVEAGHRIVVEFGGRGQS